MIWDSVMLHILWLEWGGRDETWGLHDYYGPNTGPNFSWIQSTADFASNPHPAEPPDDAVPAVHTPRQLSLASPAVPVRILPTGHELRWIQASSPRTLFSFLAYRQIGNPYDDARNSHEQKLPFDKAEEQYPACLVNRFDEGESDSPYGVAGSAL